MIKILHIIPSLETGGAQKLLSELLPVIKKASGEEMTVIVFKSIPDSPLEKELLDNGVNIISLDTSLRSPISIPKLKKHIKEADIVHAHLFPANYFVALANMGLNKPLFFTEHSTHNKRRDKKVLKPAEKWVYSRYDKIICISDATRKALADWIGPETTANRLLTIANGVNISRYKDSKGEEVKELFGREGIPLLMISRFSSSKDHATVIKALKELENPDIFVAFAGDGPTRQEMTKLSSDLGLKDRVIFLGNRNDIPHLIKSSRIGIQSSNWEGFGLTAIEMMAGGLPVIASDVNGLNQIVEGAGLLFEKGNHKELARHIRFLLDINNTQRYIQAGTIRANEYSLRNTAEEYLKLYRTFL